MLSAWNTDTNEEWGSGMERETVFAPTQKPDPRQWLEVAKKAHGIDLGKEHVNVNDALISDARLSVELSDTVPQILYLP